MSHPVWAQRIRGLREARGWTQAVAAEEMRRHTVEILPEHDHLVRRWKAWEAGQNKPGKHYAGLVAASLGTVTASLFPPDDARHDAHVLTATGMDTLEIVSRLHASDVGDSTLRAVRVVVERLCAEYAHAQPLELLGECRGWLRRIVEMQEKRLSFGQRRESLEITGWLTLLIGCLEYDLGDRRAAEGSRKAALGVGAEVGHPGILGWAHEMRAWFALTTGDYRGVIAAARAGLDAAGDHSVAVQLLAQEAKACARMDDRSAMHRALGRGRELLESLPYPDDVDNHFVVDPAKYDFYVMDCHRHIGDDRLATTLAEEVIRAGTDARGHERSPMRIAEARMTIGVAAARSGDLDHALACANQALDAPRTSLPSIALTARDLMAVLADRYPTETGVRDLSARLGANRT